MTGPRGPIPPFLSPRFEAILFSASWQSADLVVLSQGLPTQRWAKSVKSEGRQNGFDIEAKWPCR